MTTTNITYEPVENWAKMPLGISFYGDCGGVAVDSKDNVYVFNRGTDPVCVFDESGNFLRSFGHGDFDRPHGIEIDLDDNIYYLKEFFPNDRNAFLFLDIYSNEIGGILKKEGMYEALIILSNFDVDNKSIYNKYLKW